MASHLNRALVPCVLFLWATVAPAAAVHALFDLGTPSGGPFPSDQFTVRDRSNLTRIRVSLPLPDCQVRPSDCNDVSVINTLDGFNLQPRLSVPFDGSIDVDTATSQTVFLISLGSTTGHGDRGHVIGINQVVWDPERNVLHVESDELLDQHTRYALIVTRGVSDVFGVAVEASDVFRRFRETVRGEYRRALLEAIHAARRAGIREEEIVTASVFSTQSATAVLEEIRNQIKAATPGPADFLLGSGGARTLFNLSDVTDITFNQHRRTAPPMFDSVPLPFQQLRIIPDAVGQIAFGKYSSPDYETAEKFIPPVGTRRGSPIIEATNDIYFNLFLPTGTKPLSGWPVAIFGHGFGDNKDSTPLSVAATMASRGIATIAINVVGHGFGPLGTLVISAGGRSVELASGGRGFDQNGDGTIDSTEGVSAAPPRTIIGSRDGLRQTVVDLMQLVRVIDVGVDVDGDGLPDLDPCRIYYFGQSFGGIYGTKFLAVEPSVRVGVPNVPGGAISEIRRLSPGFRLLAALSLAARTPSLINPEGLRFIDGVAVLPPFFNENMPLRNQPPLVNKVAGALEIQEVFENTEWVSQSGNPVAYAPHLRKKPLRGVDAKSVIIQFAKGDQSVPNPTATAILRAGDLADRATFFRNDLAHAANPAVPTNPHTFLTRITDPAAGEFALSAQSQIGDFFASDGAVVSDIGGFFEVPIVPPLPEYLNYIP